MQEAEAVHAEFVQWATEQGISINGIRPATLPGRGLGMVASRDIQAGEKVASVPGAALLTTDRVPRAFRARHAGITVHGLLASFLAHGAGAAAHGAWRRTWPAPGDFGRSMPLLWPGAARGMRLLLPPTVGGRWSEARVPEAERREAEGLLAAQERKLAEDWAVVARAVPGMAYADYVYHWLVVNTRCFYYDAPLEMVPRTRADRMALCPFIDLFNHADRGCGVAFDDTGFTVTSDRDFAEGEELYVSYGNHSNDFLLIEYGFMLDENSWDTLPLDDLVLYGEDSGVREARDRLESHGYYGNYTLSSDGVCHRTQVAARIRTMDVRRWQKFVEKGIERRRDEDDAQLFICKQWLAPWYAEAARALECLESPGRASSQVPGEIIDVVIRRWVQIKRLIEAAITNGGGRQTQALLDFIHEYARQ